MKTKSMYVKDNILYIGEYALPELAKAYKTPLFIYDEIHIRDKIETFKDNFTSELYDCELVYASKAFIAPYLTRIIDEYDMSIDSVSLGDLYLLKQAKFPMEKVLMHGNNKSRDELLFCLHNGIGYIVVDSVEELMEISELASLEKRDVNLLLRVNPGIEAHTHAYIKTSLLSSKFGESIYDIARIKEFINICNNNKNLHIHGFHAHIGSNIHSADSFISLAEVMVNFIKQVSDECGFTTSVLNLGGGFGIRYTDDDTEVDLKAILKQMTKAIDDKLINHNLSLKKLMIEPGRSIVGDAAITIHTIGGVKKTYGGKQYVFVDGGMTDNIRPALYQAVYTVDIANRYDQGGIRKTKYDIVGKCCESSDIVTLDYPLGEVRKDDLLVSYCTGAYGYSMSSNYNGALKPAVIFVNGRDIKVAITRQSLDDLVKNEVFFDHEVFDIHTDILYDLYKAKAAGKDNRFTEVHVKQLNDSLVRAGVWTMYSPDEFDLIRACDIAVKEIELSKLPGFKVILGLEGLRNLEKVEDIDILYQKGFRHAMLTWNEENRYATGVKGNPERGLTDEGRRVLARMAELGMIIDLAHLNEKSFFEALQITNKNIIYSHGNIRKLCNHPRNVTDAQLQALKDVDGLLGLTLASSFISSNKEEVTLEKFIEHIDYAVKFMGINNVCFGFDFMDYLSDFPNSNLPAVGNATLVGVLIEGLRKHGYSEEEIRKMTYTNFFKRYKDKIKIWG